MRDDPSVVALVARAAGSDQDAWNELVERYAPLVWTICTRYRLSSHDIEDVGQNVWLLLVEQLGKLREPAALPGWLATTTSRECLRVVTAAQRLAARLDVLCRNEIDAADAALELTRVTGLLRQMIARENQSPNPADLSGVLAAGSFHSGGKRVYGYWPIERSFVEDLFGSPQR